jgi:dTDP-4-dehydrorhamnose reductase
VDNPKPQRVLLLGANGYIGSALRDQLIARGHTVLTPGSRDLDARSFDPFLSWLREFKPTFVFNSAGYTGKPNVDACEIDRAGTLAGNVLLAQTVAQACAALDIPWGHVSSGCIFSGACVRQDDGSLLAVKDLSQPALRALATQHPDRIIGFTEDDTPNFSFRDGPCSFYSGTKALGEEVLADAPEAYLRAAIWRINVAADAQGRGVGRFAIEAFADEARKRGFSRATVVWASGDAGPGAFFESVGFRVVGETPFGENLGALEL